MSKEKELLNRAKAQGRRNAKKANLSANKKRRKSVPYGSVKSYVIDSQEDLVGVVNKKKERRKNKINPNNISFDNELDITTTIL